MMIERWTRRIVAMGRSHKWLRPLTLFGLLGLFGGAALAGRRGVQSGLRPAALRLPGTESEEPSTSKEKSF